MSDTPKSKHTDTLVSRLRHSARKCLENIEYYNTARMADAHQAAADIDEDADYVEQLEAENAELRGKLEKAEDDAINSCAAYVNLTYGISALYHPIDRKRIKDSLTEQANIRSPVQSQMAKMVDPRKDEK